jgi:NhaC family Na+:H+ antiporter
MAQATGPMGALVASLTSAIVSTNVITADQYIAIVLPGRLFKGPSRSAASHPPYAVFSFVSPLLTVAMAYAGVRMTRVATATGDRP